MHNDIQPHKRKSIRLKEYNYSHSGLYFVTICAKDHHCLFGSIFENKMVLNQFGNVVHNQWLKLSELEHEILLEEFVVMPNHFHGILGLIHNQTHTERLPVGAIHDKACAKSPTVGAIHESPPKTTEHHHTRRNMLLSKLIGRFKMLSAKEINRIRNSPAEPVWQRDYYEHVIRSEKSHANIADYIRTNPLRWMKDRYYLAK